MEAINTVFKFNTKEKGYSFFWANLNGIIIDDDKLDNLFPKTKNGNSSKFTLAMTCYRMERDSIFIAIKNDWNIADTFGRQGLSLCQGSILNFNSQDTNDSYKVLEFILSYLKFYQKGYDSLKSLLSQIALNDSTEYQEKLFLYLDKEAKKSEIFLKQHEKYLIASATKKIDAFAKDRKIRVYNEFPLHEYIGLCCLIGLQLKSSDIQLVGIGDLQEYNNYEHISASRKIEGFEDVNINDIFEEIEIFCKDKIKKSFIDNVIVFFSELLNKSMANQEHVEILKTGQNEWKQWRQNNPRIIPNLKGADLRGENLTGRDLSGADLRYADLSNTDLHFSNLSGAKLREIKLINANLEGATLSRVDLTKANLYRANLRHVDLTNANCIQVDFKNADLFRANFSNANLENANLIASQALATDFSNSTLTGACIEDWNTNSDTKLDNVICNYIYLKKGQQERRPSNLNQDFKEGEFFTLVQQIQATVDLIFTKGVNWLAFLNSINSSQDLMSIDDLAIKSIEQKSEGGLVIRVSVPPYVDKAEFEKYTLQNYETQLKNIEEANPHQLESQNDMINSSMALADFRQICSSLMEIVRELAKSPRVVIQQGDGSQMSTYTHSGSGDNVGGNKSMRDQINTEINNNSTDLAQAAKEIKNLLEQISIDYPNESPRSLGAKAVDKIESNLDLRTKIFKGVRAGSLAALESMIDHPVAKFFIEGSKEFLES